MLAFITISAIAVALGVLVTPRYDSYALLLVGESMADRQSEASLRQAEDSATSLSLIAQTDDVIKDAGRSVGWARLFPGEELKSEPNLLQKARAALGFVDPGMPVADAAEPPADGGAVEPDGERISTFVTSLHRAVSVKPEAKANLIRIGFGHSDPAVVAEFANAMARALIERQAELWSRPGAVSFFEVQRKRFEEDVRKASSEFAVFVASTATYSIGEQRELLLRRVSEIGTALTATRGAIAERNGQKQALAEQLKRLKPVAASPFVSSLVDSLGGSDRGAPGTAGKEGRGLAGDPPLLLVKVYQEGLAQLLKINAELSGYSSLAEQQEKDLKRIDDELSQLVAKEAQFNKLKKAVELASLNAETYSKRMIDEQINADLVKSKMSGLKLVQAATIPTAPVFPNPVILIPGALLVALMTAIAMAMLVERIAAPRVSSAKKRQANIPNSFSGEGSFRTPSAPMEERRFAHPAGIGRERARQAPSETARRS